MTVFGTNGFRTEALELGAVSTSLHRHGWWKVRFDDAELADLFREFCADEKHEVRGNGLVLAVRPT